MQGREKLLVGLEPDVRAAFLGSRLNPMVRVPLEHIAEKRRRCQRC